MPVLRNVLSPSFHALHRAVEWLGAITPGTRAAAKFASFGEASAIAYPQATLMGCQSIHLGTGTLVGRHCTLSVGYGPSDATVRPRGLVLGDRCVIGARCTFTAHESIVIGDDVWFGQDVFITDSSHGYTNPDIPIGHQLGEHRPISIGSGSWVGNGAMILPGAQIGRNVVIGAGAVVTSVIPDHSVAVGAPARVVRTLVPGAGWTAVPNGKAEPATVADLPIHPSSGLPDELPDQSANLRVG